ncbi:MAG: DNA-processing protein DprA [Pyrinomonadaceae bacterium]|nr:DNA-processing protein DprA [Pyrinomonadaceae bacterium]MCX7640289.1 DNA-processing protein DprA [Pyrinomonadaceae bacterium]MDW8305263.1 DNA-processing protein DprA [Acidobacteriota bacterium]
MIDWIALNMTPGVGPRVAIKLIERFGSAENVFLARRKELENLRLKPETIESILNKEFHKKAEEELVQVERIGGEVLTLDDGLYPALLREILDPPIVLYVKGNWKECLDMPCIAVVGSRRCSTYGENACSMLTRELAKRGICIASGLARGIDSAAHRAAIEVKGKTIAVLGTGIDEVYPRENKSLVEKILQNKGALISQFPLKTPPLKDNFPYRNRIISGLSLGVLVVEASERSGSLITAYHALEQNREVFAVPGNITSRNSFGTNYLIKTGAKLVQQWQDIVVELPEEIRLKLLSEKTQEKRPQQTSLMPADLTETERKVYELLLADEPTHFDTIVEIAQTNVADLSIALLALETRGLIRSLPGNRFVKNL